MALARVRRGHRDAGAVPATIAIIGGKICVGLSEDQLELLGSSPDAMKVSRRDLGYEPKTPIDVGLPRFIAWYKDYHGIA